MSSPQVFISYSSVDKEFVGRLRLDLLSTGVSSWIYEKEIRPGDSIPGSVWPAIAKSDYFFLVLSAASVESAKTFVSEGRGISIMPHVIVREDVLSGKMWAVRLPGDVSRPFYGISAKDRGRSSVAEEFIALLKAGLECRDEVIEQKRRRK